MFLRPVEGASDTFAFQYDFMVEGKAVQGEDTAETVTELENGDLLIEGWAAVFEGVDREGENFEPGAFKRGVKSFLQNQAALCYHHDKKLGIGSVLDLKEEEGKGLWMKARVDYQEETSPLRWIYSGIKKGSMKGLSVGGFFKRKLTDGGFRISDVDFTEVSVTPVPMHPGTSFAVVAGKALEAEAEETPAVEPGDDVLQNLSDAIDNLDATFERHKALPRSHDPEAASWLGDFIQRLAATRSFASTVKSIEVSDDLSSLADEAETALSGLDSKAHKLAAKVGPLPPASVGL